MTDSAILDALPGLSALIVGDICLDHWCHYDPALALQSAETGIPRVAILRTKSTAGAGGTVANNLAALGVGRVSVLGIVGCDGYGFELRQALSASGIHHELLVEAPGVQTFTYTKLINQATGREDLPRVDFLMQPTSEAERLVLDRLLPAIDAHDLILIADQAETDTAGVVTAAVRNLIAELATVYRDKVFLADSRRRARHFRRVLLKANREEAEAAAAPEDLASLRQKTKAPVLFVTQGGDGVRLFQPDGEAVVAVPKVENPVDICGAGDSFAAGAAAAYFLTGSAIRAAEFGSRVARITIGKPGTGVATPEEVLAL